MNKEKEDRKFIRLHFYNTNKDILRRENTFNKYIFEKSSVEKIKDYINDAIKKFSEYISFRTRDYNPRGYSSFKKN